MSFYDFLPLIVGLGAIGIIVLMGLGSRRSDPQLASWAFHVAGALLGGAVVTGLIVVVGTIMFSMAGAFG